jgi:thiamine kinase-like enzyme
MTLTDLMPLAESMLPKLCVDNIEPLAKGLSNKNYVLQTNQGKLLLKCYTGGVPEVILHVQNELADIGVTHSVKSYDCNKRSALFEFIEEAVPFKMLDEDIIRCLASVHEYRSVKHTTPVDVVSFVKQLDKGEQEYAEHHTLRALSLISALPRELAFCHNDLVFDNLINAEQGAKFIDFEYAQYNDIYFDLAALSCSFDLDEQGQSRLLKTYYKHRNLTCPQYAQDKLLAYQIVYLRLSIKWYQLRAANSHALPLISRLKNLLD